ncbi:Mu-like prophage protein gpG [Leminorella richardii]|uniref:Mu-like prophage protein gpG n=1 Tax=Leminorella richardii TaxID=158841 RepID=A0A2X4U7K5_9GAMM|nr:phage virion morphogenesis protein [Leminorella richardii]SQI34951.1 Mu-like prophage protein gpG [Leminorella richardii]
MQIDYKFDSAPLDEAVKRLVALGQDMTPITRAISAVLASESENAFDREKDPATGQSWPALTDKYRERLEKLGKNGKMLQRSMGGLAMSLTPDFDAVSATIGTNKVYGALMQSGGTSGMPPGPSAVLARPYMGLSPEGVTQIVDIINETLSKASNG